MLFEEVPEEAQMRYHLTRKKGIRLIVFGGRDYINHVGIWSALDTIHRDLGIRRLIHGGCRGADLIAGSWAQKHGVFEEVHPAEWDVYGPAAGPKRNEKMAALGADYALALPGGKGTDDMAKRCYRHSIKILRPEDFIDD